MKKSHFKQNKEIKIATQTHANVLITGPTGTGKSTLAQWIHEHSSRSKKQFISINLACLNQSLIESELFGHQKGAFTGATENKIGLLELANHGTVFLDEIAEIPPHIQSKLLDFLQYKNIRPIGSENQTQLDVRIITATHQNLAQLIEQGKFRPDLFHRLNTIPIQTNTLQERSDEFNDFVHTYIEEFSRTYSKKIIGLTEDVARLLENYPWPGNLRELRNVIEYCVLSCSETLITTDDIPSWLKNKLTENHFSSYKDALSKYDKDLIQQALIQNQWQIRHAARSLGISISALKRKVKKYAIQNSRELLA